MKQQNGPHSACASCNKNVMYFLEKIQLHLPEVKNQFVMQEFAANHFHNLQEQGGVQIELPIFAKEIQHEKLYLIFGLLKALGSEPSPS